MKKSAKSSHGPLTRSETMSRIRSFDTAPEMRVRKILWCLGYRYRLHDKRLPGKPDIVFWGRRKVIFVHGCFWHQHVGCADSKLPKSNIEYWHPKLRRNVERDASSVAALESAGWEVLIVWDCQTRATNLLQILTDFMES
ncbi:very short patch repair endonuclease [Burkholderia savannae]|uniref:very short patch repair endonuclease n=1 Tax=Burkholderia savannae TaxID=1637837 RepID=UPI0009EB29B1|nr:very short patch repair endonuclease [Burkholderia savannae]